MNEKPRSNCRDAIKKHLLQIINANLFAKMLKLGLPKPLEKYLLFSELFDGYDDDTAEDEHYTCSV